MKDYYDLLREVRGILKEHPGISAYDLCRVTKDLCSCGKCEFFVPHYLADGTLTDFGHCRKNKIPKAVRPRDSSCGFWVDGGFEG